MSEPDKPYVLALISSRADFLIYPKDTDKTRIESRLSTTVLVEAPVTKAEAVEFQKSGVRAVK